MSDRAGHILDLVQHRLDVIVDGKAHAEGDELRVHRDELLRVLSFCKSDRDADLSLLVDVTAVDRGRTVSPRYAVIWLLRSPRLGYRARVVVDVEADDMAVPSVTSLYDGADVLERELHDMFGIFAEGHPNLRPLLLYSGFVGHPLRRDYRANKAQPLVPLRDLNDPANVDAKPTIVDDGEVA